MQWQVLWIFKNRGECCTMVVNCILKYLLHWLNFNLVEKGIVCIDFLFLHHYNEEKKIDYDLLRNFYLFLSGSWKLPTSHELLFVRRKQLFESFHSLFAEKWKMRSKCFRQFCIIWWNFTKDKCYSTLGN